MSVELNLVLEIKKHQCLHNFNFAEYLEYLWENCELINKIPKTCSVVKEVNATQHRSNKSSTAVVQLPYQSVRE